MTTPNNFATTFAVDSATGTVQLAVVGEFDSSTVDAFETASGRVVDLEPTAVELDLAGADLIDSAAIGAIMRFRRALQPLPTTLKINAPLPFQQRLFEITGLSFILDTEATTGQPVGEGNQGGPRSSPES